MFLHVNWDIQLPNLRLLQNRMSGIVFSPNIRDPETCYQIIDLFILAHLQTHKSKSVDIIPRIYQKRVFHWMWEKEKVVMVL